MLYPLMQLSVGDSRFLDKIRLTEPVMGLSIKYAICSALSFKCTSRHCSVILSRPSGNHR